jgi:hypothetical protein
MTTVKEIKEAVSGLPPDELAQFRAWFKAFDAERFDAKIECDSKAGKFDKLAKEAKEDFRARRA